MRPILTVAAPSTSLHDYALLQTQTPGHDVLVSCVDTLFEGQDRDDLVTLARAMSEADITSLFGDVDEDVTKYQNVLCSKINVFFYGCQALGDLNVISIGEDERYEVPDAVIYGG